MTMFLPEMRNRAKLSWFISPQIPVLPISLQILESLLAKDSILTMLK